MVKFATLVILALALVSPSFADGNDKKKSLAGAAAIVTAGAGVGTIASKFIGGTAGTVVGAVSAAASLAGAGATIRKKYFHDKKPDPILPTTNPSAFSGPAPGIQKPAPAVVKGSAPPPPKRH